MALPLDGDILGFLWTTGTVLFASKPQLRKNSRPVPLRYQREIVEDASLTEAQKKYLAPLEQKLEALNYRPLCTFRVTNYGSNLIREYRNAADPASCTLTVVEVQTNVNGVRGVKNSCVVNFTTRFSGGKWLTTRNMEVKTVLDTPEYRIVQECPNVTDVAQLKKRHDARAATMGTPLSPPSDVEGVFLEGQQDHERFSAFQLQRGTYKLNPQGDAYLITDKAFNRGIWNHFNPFARRISLPEAIFSILIGALLPLLGILKLAPAATESLGPASALSINPSTLVIAACYAFAGLILGLIAETQNYVWVLLITYIPAHIIAGSSLGWIPYSTLAFLVSFYVCQAKRRRQLVLQS